MDGGAWWATGGREESDTTERLHFHFSLSCIGEGNGNPVHCSCLENPRDRGTWWAAVSGVAQSRTRLKQVSSSSSSSSLRTHNLLNPLFPRKLRSLCFKLEYKTCIQIIMLQIKSDDYGQKITCQLLLAFRMIAVLSSLIVSHECIFLDSLSRYNKDLE